jgi:hypothetical protein
MQEAAGTNCIDLDRAARPTSPIRNGSSSALTSPIRFCSSSLASGIAVTVTAKGSIVSPALSPQLARRPGGRRRRYDD